MKYTDEKNTNNWVASTEKRKKLIFDILDMGGHLKRPEQMKMKELRKIHRSLKERKFKK